MRKIFRSTDGSEPSAASVNGSCEQSTDPSSLANGQRTRELAERFDHGLEVTLLWHPARDELTVHGRDHRTGARFEIRPERHLALEVYYHPYSYLTGSEISYEDYRLAEPDKR